MANRRDEARALMESWTSSESLRKHGMAVAICCEAYGRLEPGAADELVDLYACAGLLHDFDYERHPTVEEHPFVGVAYLREAGWPEEMLHAILAHADYSGVVPETRLDKVLFACDELAGFLTACALVKPTKKIAEVEVKGVVKKMKDKGFARAVKREDMTRGAELLGGEPRGACGGLSGSDAGAGGGVGAVTSGSELVAGVEDEEPGEGEDDGAGDADGDDWGTGWAG